MIKNLYSSRTIKYSKTLYIKIQLKQIPTKLLTTIIMINKFPLKSKKISLKFYTKLKSSKHVLNIKSYSDKL